MKIVSAWIGIAVALCIGASAALAAGKVTCGQMTARFASQPMAIGKLLTATADHLDAHAAIVGQSSDKAAAVEVAGLQKIIGHLRAAAGELGKAADEMRAAANWPDAPHDMVKLRADAKNTAARDAKVAALGEAAAEIQKEIEFWKAVPTAKK